MSSSSTKDYEEYTSRLRADPKCHSLLKQCLTPEVFAAVKDKKTSQGGTLDLLVASGMQNTDSSIGVYACDADAYQVFAPLFNSIILSYHHLQPDFKQPALNFGDPQSFKNLDPGKKYIISTRIRCARSLKGFPLNSLLTKDKYLEIEDKVKKILTDPSTGLDLTYRALADMSESEKTQLINDHFLFKEGDRFLQAAQASNHWPSGRGLFLNSSKTLGLWVNEEDHLRIFSLQSDANLPEIYNRLVRTIEVLSQKIDFVRDDRLGYLTFCPSNIGTTIRASVHIRLPRLAQNQAELEKIADGYGLQVRGTHGEHSAVDEGVFDISNKRRCGLSEFEVVKSLQDGILKIIEMEEGKGA